jgi:NAD-reducing hydrogenase large subunit
MTERYRHLETAEHPETLRRLAIDPVTRVEGHGKVTLLLDDQHRIRQARLHIVEFRGFEKFIQGRPFFEVPVLVQRLCGICPVSHLLAAAKAVDRLVGVQTLPPSAEKLRRLLHYGQVLQSHALHFFHLASPDLLFGFDSPTAKRNIFELLREERFRDLALKGIKLRKFGQEVIQAVIGKRIHGVGPIPGGMNKHLTRAERDYLEAQLPQVLTWAAEGVELVQRVYRMQPDFHQRFARIDSKFLALVRPDGGHELYDGRLRVIGEDGRILFDQVEEREYLALIHEQVKSWSYMKFPYLAALGPESGWYRVGPLARLNACEFFDTPKAEAARREFRQLDQGLPVQSSLAYHLARMIEILHCAEKIQALLADPELYAGPLVSKGEMGFEGIGVIEAPRGTLIHHYQIDEDGLVRKANLIVSTTHNNTAMNESIRQVAAEYLDGRELNEELLSRIEIAIRAYDPCLSCATHALGKMPLWVEIEDAEGKTLHRLCRFSG